MPKNLKTHNNLPKNPVPVERSEGDIRSVKTAKNGGGNGPQVTTVRPKGKGY